MSKRFYVSFDTKSFPGKIMAIGVELHNELVRDHDKSFAINLSDHPLYPHLEKYVKNNPSKQPLEIKRK